MWPAIIGGAVSALGSLFGGSKKQVTASHVDFKRLVRDSEAAGFNPLTALRNGGAAGYSVTTSPGAPLTSRVAEAISGGVQNFLANYDPFKDQRREAEFKVHEANLANLQADTALKQMQARQIGSVPTYTASNMKRVVGSGVKHGQTFKSAADAIPGFKDVKVPDLSNRVPTTPGAAQPNGNPLASQPPETVRPERINPYPSYLGWERNPWTAGGDAFEGAFGDTEIGSMLNTGVEFGHDIVWNYPLPGVVTSSSKGNRSWAAGTTRKVISDLWNGRTRSRNSIYHPPALSGKRGRVTAKQ